MIRENLSDLAVFVAVARARSFTRAAIELGVSQSALSHAMRQFEQRLGMRLLARTTRSVAPTAVGERLLEAIGPHVSAIEVELAALGALRERPAGLIRLTAVEHAAITIVYPAVRRLAAAYPDIRIEMSVDNAPVDIVSHRFDAGVRLYDEIERDMIAVRIGPDMRMAIVATPDYFALCPPPEHPRDIARHNCINVRLPTYGPVLPWEFARGREHMTLRAEGQLIFNARVNALGAVLDGLGLGCCPEDLVAEHVAEGRLVRVLDDWCQPVAGYHLYYPGTRQLSPVFALLVEAIRNDPLAQRRGRGENLILQAWDRARMKLPAEDRGDGDDEPDETLGAR